jgi:hypothetical protein
MKDSTDDARTATGLAVSLSGYVAAAALAVLAVQAGIATFVMDSREGLTWFYVFVAAAVGCLVLAIILGGRGSWSLIKNGYEGRWTINPSGGVFNWQAVLTLAGLVFVVLSSFAGTPKKDEPGVADRLTPQLLAQTRELRRESTDLAAANARLQGQVNRLEAEVARIRARVP